MNVRTFDGESEAIAVALTSGDVPAVVTRLALSRSVLLLAIDRLVEAPTQDERVQIRSEALEEARRAAMEWKGP